MPARLFPVLLISATPALAQDLPRLTLAPGSTTVSGLSSGAYMAGQMHVAHSADIAGAALFAGGPWACAGGSLMTALGECMDSDPGGPDVAPLVAAARASAEAGAIDPLDGLLGDRVLVFTGRNDETVLPQVTRAAAGFYRQAGLAAPALRLIDDSPAGHGMPVPGGPVACAETDSPYLNDCPTDGAGIALAHLLDIDLPAPGAPDPEALVTFSQAPFLADPGDHGLAGTGHAYIPAVCRDGATCRLHIAFHGCNQGAGKIGETFVREAGYNRWAEALDLVILYPQIRASLADGNPNGCWDWWGYDDPDHATRGGPQVAAVARMAAALGADLPSDACIDHEGWNGWHHAEGRAQFCAPFTLCATGSGDPIGAYWLHTTIREAPDGSFHAGACP